MSKAYGISNYIKEAYQDSIKVSYSTLSSIVNSDILENNFILVKLEKYKYCWSVISLGHVFSNFLLFSIMKY